MDFVEIIQTKAVKDCSSSDKDCERFDDLTGLRRSMMGIEVDAGGNLTCLRNRTKFIFVMKLILSKFTVGFLDVSAIRL